jgi:deoxyribodipyrimidine photo-lyase
MSMEFSATRADGLAALKSVTGGLGARYAARRNTDAGEAATTSRLSPWLRRRMVLEVEAMEAARAAHGEGAEKFVQELVWRTYFKGHLETRPWLWTAYREEVAEGLASAGADYAAAVEGRTGIEGFDDWARALVADGWLHNHARMWFASIWIFTLRLPWALGAYFFMRHLLDGDPASNTLSWRWVAGLHTRGKHYVARAENIRRYTEGRFDPRGLNEEPEPLSEPEGRAAVKLPAAGVAPAGEVALLLHLDDLHPESLALGGARVARVCPVLAHADGASAAVRAWDTAAMADAVARAAAHFGCEVADEPGERPKVAAWAPVGPSADALPECVRIRRAWDDRVWPISTKGFFKVKAAIADL